MGSLNENYHSSVPFQKPDLGAASYEEFQERITLLLSRWHGLQMAVQNQWGGHDSFQKSQQLASDIFYWFSQSQALEIEDLENLLHETMLLSLNTEIEDGSIEEVAEQLMIMHEEHLRRNH
ncbi:Pre-rRNA-processing protein TSR2 [Corchorus olitorius]|uniref:Pre-rRNA-processing protein TSR2 n=1 Tax=Corchorus olitorius TaxID=93759 RepID=A0A1R3IT15_9ROSI|nr:Pre-rRNA-processing protein TSR2 [Corchorus olitorius]